MDETRKGEIALIYAVETMRVEIKISNYESVMRSVFSIAKEAKLVCEDVGWLAMTANYDSGMGILKADLRPAPDSLLTWGELAYKYMVFRTLWRHPEVGTRLKRAAGNTAAKYGLTISEIVEFEKALLHEVVEKAYSHRSFERRHEGRSKKTTIVKGGPRSLKG